MQTFSIDNLQITAVAGPTDRICYLLYPLATLHDWLLAEAPKFGVAVAVITRMDWDDDLTPWSAKGQPPGCPDFQGRAAGFLAKLQTDVLPAVEKRLGIAPGAERTLAGVSLSGLFTLWQWMLCDTFTNIISLSGSFWYEGFAAWIESHPVPKKTGRAYFLLGNQEAHTNVKAFQPVQTDTEAIVASLRRQGIAVDFELVPGNHYQYGEQRLTRAFTRMFG